MKIFEISIGLCLGSRDLSQHNGFPKGHDMFFFQKESKFPSFLIRDFHSRGAMHVMGLVYVSHILKLLNSVKLGEEKCFVAR